MNKVILSGRPTRDPEIRRTQSGMAVAALSLAVDRIGKDKGADFFELTAWDKTAEFCEKYIRKGTKIMIEGHLQNDQFTDKAGNKRTVTKVVIERMEFCESKKAGEAAPQAKAEEDFVDMTGEELPFAF